MYCSLAQPLCSMVSFNIYIFNRQGTCLHYHEWHRPKSVKQGAGSLEDDQKQIFGLFWTLNNFATTLNPKDSDKLPLGTPRKIGHGCQFRSFRTNNYKLHFFEAPSGIKVVLNTSPEVGDLRNVTNYIYEEIYVGTVLKNPLYLPGQPFKCDAFTMALTSYLRNRGLLRQ